MTRTAGLDGLVDRLIELRDDPSEASPRDPEAARAERILRERFNGIYAEWGRVKFAELVATRNAGRSVRRVKNPYLTPATPAMLRGVGRNQLCPCGSGRKTKWCCG